MDGFSGGVSGSNLWVRDGLLRLGYSFGTARKWSSPKFLAEGLERVGNGLSKGDRPRPKVDRTRTHLLDEEVFGSITEESAYWAGFLMADGCLYGSDCIALLLAGKDVAHIEKLKKFIRSSHAVSYTEFTGKDGYSRQRAQFKFRSLKTVYALAKFGFVSGKPNRAASNSVAMNRDFWRGVVDADGSLHKRVGVNLSSSAKLVEQFDTYIRSTIANSVPRVRRHEKFSQIDVWGDSAILLIGELYEGSSIYLDRKYELATQIIGAGAK